MDLEHTELDGKPVEQPQVEGHQPVEAQPARPTKVTFDLAQQQKIDSLIKDAQSRAAKGLRGELNQALTRIRELEARAGVLTDDDGAKMLATELATARAENAVLKSEQEKEKLSDALRTAAGNAFVDTNLAVQIMRSQVRLIDGKVVVLDQDGNPRMNAHFEPMTPQELAVDLANTKPFLARGEVRGGTGSFERNSAPTTSQTELERFYGAKPDVAGLNRLAIRDPRRFRELKRLATEKGMR